jgi:hypothetical protein
MKHLKLFEEFILNENDGILIVVDVQKEFEKFIPQGYVQKLNEYCKSFNTVYQIWDSNKATKPSWKFANEKNAYEKKYGTTAKDILDVDGNDRTGSIKNIAERLSEKYTNAKEGEKFKLKDRESYVVRVVNNHKWFYCNEGLTELFNTLKGKKVVVVGGADNECLEDVYESMEAFGVKPIYNHEFIYSAKTNHSQQVNPKINSPQNKKPE